MLVLEPKINQLIVLRDTISGAKITVRTFRRRFGQFAIAFDAPMSVKITMERQGKTKTESDCEGAQVQR